MEELATFGPAGAVVAVVWIFFKYFVPALDRLSKSIDHNTKVTNEMYKYMKNLNGELKKVAKKKLEQ